MRARSVPDADLRGMAYPGFSHAATLPPAVAVERLQGQASVQRCMRVIMYSLTLPASRWFPLASVSVATSPTDLRHEAAPAGLKLAS